MYYQVHVYRIGELIWNRGIYEIIYVMNVHVLGEVEDAKGSPVDARLNRWGTTYLVAPGIHKDHQKKITTMPTNRLPPLKL